MENEVLILIFDELCKDVKARDYVKYLFKDLLTEKFELSSISGRVVFDFKAAGIDMSRSSESVMKRRRKNQRQ